MGTTADKLSYLRETKELIKSALLSRNAPLPENATFRAYADYIQYFSPLPDRKSFSDATFQEISTISKMGLASKYFSLGDKKQISFNGEIYFVEIVGFDHDDVSDPESYGREKAGITIQFGESGPSAQNGVYKTKYPMYSYDPGDGLGSWEESTIRTSTIPQMKNYLPSDLRSVIVPVKKKSRTQSRYDSIKTLVEDLFLPSASELFGREKLNYLLNEGARYEFYKNGASLIRNLDGSAKFYYTRSATKTEYAANFYVVMSNGGINRARYDSSYNITFMFCI